MTDRKNLPIQLTDRALVSSSEGHCSLVTRGMDALRNIDNDVIYRQARKSYNEITGNGTMSWSGYGERKSRMGEVFEIFQNLANKGYGKAYYPLSSIYYGFQGIEGNKKLQAHYQKLSLNWLISHECLNDPEIYLDLSSYYFDEDDDLYQHWIQKGADTDDPECMWILSIGYEVGYGVKKDFDESRYWEIKAAMSGHTEAQHGLEVQHNRGDLDIDDEQVFDWYIWSAEQGHVWAQVLLADRYFQGHCMGTSFEDKKEDCSYWHDEKQAVHWYEKAAIQGDAHAQLELGKMYWEGLSCIEEDNEQARYWLEKSAEQGGAESQYQFGMFLYQMSEGEQATVLVEWAAEQNYGPAQYDYASLLSEDYQNLSDEDLEYCCDLFESAFIWYFEHASESTDLELRYDYASKHLQHCNNWRFNRYGRANKFKGLRLLREIADEPVLIDQPLHAYSWQRRACRVLGERMLNDNPVKEEVFEAIHWLEQAANLGDAYVYEVLAELYLYGHAGGGYCRKAHPRLVEIDQKLAVSWYERGIQLGGMRVAYKLGRHYLEGKHLPQNLELAEKWLLHSANAGYDSAQECLGSEYASGLRFRQDADAAIYWLSKAGVTGACLKLAGIYLDGKITPRNMNEALKGLTRQRDERKCRWNDAMKLLARKCFDGRFNAAEEAAAQAWIVKTAEMSQQLVANPDDRSDMCATASLAELYELGLGIEKDMEKAIYWYRKSAKNGSNRAKEHLRELGIE